MDFCTKDISKTQASEKKFVKSSEGMKFARWSRKRRHKKRPEVSDGSG